MEELSPFPLIPLEPPVVGVCGPAFICDDGDVFGAGLCEHAALLDWDDCRFPDGFTTAGRCRRCGCTDARPCRDGGQGCAWANDRATLCSRCVDFPDRRRFRRRRLSLDAAAARIADWRRHRLTSLQMAPGQYGRA